MNVGSAFITIKPDTSKFRGDLTRQLKPLLVQAEKSLRGIKVDVQANTGYANRAIATLARNAKDLDRMKVTVTPAVDVAKGRAQLRALENQLRRLDGRTANVRVDSTTGNIGETIRDADRAMRSFDSTSKSTAKSSGDLNDSLGSLVGGFGALAAAQALIKTPLMIEGITAAIGGVTALGGAAVALTSALTPLAGLLPVAGAGGLAVAQGFGVAKLASLGLSDAMKASAKSDESVEAARKKLSAATREFGANSTQAKSAQKALTEALDEQKRVFNDVSPAAARFGRLLLDLKPKMKDVQELAAEGLFPGAERGLRSLVDGLLPTFRTAIGNTAKTLGELAAEAGRTMGSPFFAGRFAAIAARNDVIMQSLGRAALGLVAPLVRILDTAGPLAARFASLAEKQSGVLAAFVRSREESGRLDKAFATVDVTARRLGTIVSAVGRTLGTVFREAMPAGQQYLGMLVSSTTHMRDLARVAADSGSLRRFFDATIPVTREFAGLIGDVVKGLAGVGRSVMPELTPLLQLIRADLVPAVLNLVSTLDTQFLTALVRLATTGANFLTTFATATPILTAVVNGLEGVLRVANFLGNELGPLSPLIVNVVAALSSLGAVSAGIKIARMISDFASTGAGLKLLGVGADAAAASTGRLSTAMAGLTGFLTRIAPVVAIGYAIKATFDQIAPSIDKTVASMAKGPTTAAAFYESLNKLNNPSLVDQFTSNIKAMFNEGPLRSWDQIVNSTKVSSEEAFRALATSSADAAVAVRDSMAKGGYYTGEFDRILEQLGITQAKAAEAANKLTSAIDRQASQFLAASANEVAYQEAVDNLTESLERNSTAGFDANTAAGRENIRARDALISSVGNLVSAYVEEARQNGVNTEKQQAMLAKLYELRDSGYPGAKDQAELYIAKINEIPTSVSTTVDIDTTRAVARIADLTARLAYLERVGVSAENNINRGTAGDPEGRHAGGPVRKGVPYVVGEKRPELFVPDESGYIIPKVPPHATPRVVHEDSPEWDWRTMGNKNRGVYVDGRGWMIEDPSGNLSPHPYAPGTPKKSGMVEESPGKWVPSSTASRPLGGSSGGGGGSRSSTGEQFWRDLLTAIRGQNTLLERMAAHTHPVNIDGHRAGTAIGEANSRTRTARSRG